MQILLIMLIVIFLAFSVLLLALAKQSPREKQTEDKEQEEYIRDYAETVRQTGGSMKKLEHWKVIAIYLIGCTLLKTIGILKLDYFYILFLVSNYLVSALVEMISYFCRGINQIVILTVSSVAQTMTTIVSNLLFLLVLKSGLNYNFFYSNFRSVCKCYS